MQKTILIGNLGNAPELRYTQGGKPVCNFSVATTERWKDQQGEKQEQTEWHRIIAWNAQAEFCAEYLDKGMKVYIEGKNRTRKWKDESGVDRYITEIQLREIEPQVSLKPKSSDSNGRSNDHSGNNDEPPLPPQGYPGNDDVPF